MNTATHHTAPRDFAASDWKALHGRTDALLVHSAGEEQILATRYEARTAADVFVITTASGEYDYRVEDGVVTVRMPATTIAAIRAANR